ncbi:hypothetical protein GGD66_002548 [Bradyrhizobium sp. CIR48]|nr:hypothetical protein [Bradyrhizobium sp. CIR48]
MRTAARSSLAPNVCISISARDQSFWLTLRAYALAANRSRASAKTDESATYVRARQPRSELLT